jgi:RluA family pseudouridine synthase
MKQHVCHFIIPMLLSLTNPSHPAVGNWDGTVVNALAYYLRTESPFGMGDLFTNNTSKVVDPNGLGVPDDHEVNQNDAVTNSLLSLRPGIVHRLDKGTSGVLIVAKTSSALANLSEAFASRKVKKQYLAVTVGNPGADQWINKPIGRHPLHRQKMRVVPDPSPLISARGQVRLARNNAKSPVKRGRPALSHIHTIHHDGKLSLVQVEIATGRTHQIRVHLQDHGTPIYGDDVYGMTDWNKVLSAQRGITRPLLHAHKLQIDHPVTGEQMVFEAQVAADMMEVITAIWPAGHQIEF